MVRNFRPVLGVEGRMDTTRLRAALVVVATGLLAACAGGGNSATPTTTTTGPATEVSATVDWRARTVDVAGLEGFGIGFCEGEAPFLCVSRDGAVIGAIELVSFPGGGAALDGGVDAWVADHVGSLAEDRRAGCDPGYQLTADDTGSVPFAGLPGYRYGFTGEIGGRPVERVVGAGVVADGHLHLLVLNALADDGCLAREGELPLDAVDDLAPVVEALAAGTVALPPVTPPPPPSSPR